MSEEIKAGSALDGHITIIIGDLKNKLVKAEADLAVAKSKNELLKNISKEGIKNWSNKQAQRLAEFEGENDKLKGIAHGDSAIAIIEQLEADLAGRCACMWSKEGKLLQECDYHKEQAQRIAELESALEKHRWIPISERLPKNVATVWVLLNAKAVDSLAPALGFYGEMEENNWGWELFGQGILSEVTHWKPIILPEQALKDKKGG